MRHLTVAVVLAALAGCDGFRPIVDADLGFDGDGGGVPDLAGPAVPGADLAGADLAGGALDGGTPPCGQLAALPCLPRGPRVIEVPTDASISTALNAAQAGDTVQVRGVTVGAGTLTVPAAVTLHGCDGARLAATVRFAGAGGAVEGFAGITGGIVANATGTYNVTDNIFRAPVTAGTPAISARSIDGLVSADVTLRVERNLFTDRDVGVEAATRYDTMTHTVTLTVLNNAFRAVATPVSASEAGLVGKISLRVEHNTFVGFDAAVRLTDVTYAAPAIVSNVFLNGTNAVAGNSAFTIGDELAYMVTTPVGGGSQLSGSFMIADPLLVNPAADDYHPAAGSPALARIGSPLGVPDVDLYRCRRPALRALGAAERAP
jgi:hypothetical protein